MESASSYEKCFLFVKSYLIKLEFGTAVDPHSYNYLFKKQQSLLLVRIRKLHASQLNVFHSQLNDFFNGNLFYKTRTSISTNMMAMNSLLTHHRMYNAT